MWVNHYFGIGPLMIAVTTAPPIGLPCMALVAWRGRIVLELGASHD